VGKTVSRSRAGPGRERATRCRRSATA